MKIELIVIGKTTDNRLSSLIDDYAARITHYMPFEYRTIPALKQTSSLTHEQQKQAEGEQLLRLVQPGDVLVLFDERGKEFSSLQLASWLEQKQQTARKLMLVIGGPYGFSEAVYRRANEKLSLSRLTLSHQMVRLFAAEQIYRACTIIRGEPYHHE